MHGENAAAAPAKAVAKAKAKPTAKPAAGGAAAGEQDGFMKMAAKTNTAAGAKAFARRRPNR